jgi:CheY-like chemotaxis protein
MSSGGIARTILLVDDSATIRLLVRAYLVGQRFEFLETADGREALLLIRRCPPDLVISDVFMPHMSGWDLVRMLRKEPRLDLRNIPVILASSKKDEEVAQRSIESGANAFLQKPITGERLLQVMKPLLLRNTGSEPAA